MATVLIIIAEDAFGAEDEGDLTAWTHEDGDRVTLGQTVAEVSTSKAIVEIEAPANGLLQHRCRPGELIRAGQTIGAIETDA